VDAMSQDEMKYQMDLLEKAFNDGKLTDKEYDEHIDALIKEYNK
jgi:hypothetical protein